MLVATHRNAQVIGYARRGEMADDHRTLAKRGRQRRTVVGGLAGEHEVGQGWENFEANMRRVLPDGRFVDLDASLPIFHSFFEIDSLDIIPQHYDRGRPILRGLFEGNDPSKRLQMIVNYNTDISQFWEWSGRGLRPFDETNEAYKLGVNYIMYGMTH